MGSHSSSTVMLLHTICLGLVEHIDPRFEGTHPLSLNMFVHALALDATSGRMVLSTFGSLCGGGARFGFDNGVPKLAQDSRRKGVYLNLDLVSILERCGDKSKVEKQKEKLNPHRQFLARRHE